MSSKSKQRRQQRAAKQEEKAKRTMRYVCGIILLAAIALLIGICFAVQ